MYVCMYVCQRITSFQLVNFISIYFMTYIKLETICYWMWFIVNDDNVLLCLTYRKCYYLDLMKTENNGIAINWHTMSILPLISVYSETYYNCIKVWVCCQWWCFPCMWMDTCWRQISNTLKHYCQWQGRMDTIIDHCLTTKTSVCMMYPATIIIDYCWDGEGGGWGAECIIQAVGTALPLIQVTAEMGVHGQLCYTCNTCVVFWCVLHV